MSDPAQTFIDGLCGSAECSVCRNRFDALKAAGENLTRLAVRGRAREPRPPDAAHQKITTTTTNQKEGKSMGKKKALKKLEKEVARQQYPSVSRPATPGVNLAGAASTIGSPGTAERVVSSFLSGLEQRVTKAQDDAAAADSSGTAMARDRARQGLRVAMRQRLLGKLVVKESIDANRPPSQFGKPIFAPGSTFNIGDDDGLGYSVGGGRPPVR